jgi:hypothetical protein
MLNPDREALLLQRPAIRPTPSLTGKELFALSACNRNMSKLWLRNCWLNLPPGIERHGSLEEMF